MQDRADYACNLCAYRSMLIVLKIFLNHEKYRSFELMYYVVANPATFNRLGLQMNRPYSLPLLHDSALISTDNDIFRVQISCFLCI